MKWKEWMTWRGPSVLIPTSTELRATRKVLRQVDAAQMPCPEEDRHSSVMN